MPSSDLKIIDAHHHIWIKGDQRFMCDELYDTLNGCGVELEATVFIECSTMYRRSGPEEFRSVGEVEFACGAAAIGESGIMGPTRICAAVVGHADLMLGDGVRPVLERLCAAGNGRLAGVRYITANDSEVKVQAPADLMLHPTFCEGFRALKDFGLKFDAWLYHPQLPQLLALVRKVPDVPVVINHTGGLLGMGRYARLREDSFAVWKRNLAALAAEPNVYLKLGGFSLPAFGLIGEGTANEAALATFAEKIRPIVETAVEMFGAERCMFESNAPVDLDLHSYGDRWRSFMRASAGFSDSERASVFAGTARNFYGIA